MVLALLYLAQLLRYIDLHGLNGLAWLGLVILVTAFVAAFRKIHVTWQIIESDAQVVIQKDKKVVSEELPTTYGTFREMQMIFTCILGIGNIYRYRRR